MAIFSKSNAKVSLLALSVVFALSACDGDDGAQGPAGPAGAQGPAGPAGADGSGSLVSLTTVTELQAPGVRPCFNGFVITQTGLDDNGDGILEDAEVDSFVTSCGTTQQPAPMSSLVATFSTDGNSIPAFVRGMVDSFATSTTAPVGFPLAQAVTDSVRTIPGIGSNVVTQWFQPLSTDPSGPLFGANLDYTSYFGDGWDSDWGANDEVGSAPQFNGDPRSGIMWANHEFVSNGIPQEGSAPTGQHLSNALFAMGQGILNFDVTSDAAWTLERAEAYINIHKAQVGGSVFRVSQQENGEWRTELTADAERFDASSNTVSTVTDFVLNDIDINDDGSALLAGQIGGILGNCSGGTSPWGTIISAEENVQSSFGDLEDAWGSRQEFDPTPTNDGSVWGPGANVTINYAPAAAGSARFTFTDESLNHERDVYGFLNEIDIREDSNVAYTSVADGGDGAGHRKIGSLGRARWENATFATDEQFELIDGQPVVMYAANDRRSGRIYKWVSEGNYSEGMTRAQVRTLLDTGSLFVAHFADMDNRTGYTLAPTDATSTCATTDVSESGPAEDKAAIFALGCVSPTEDNRGNGEWILLSTSNTAQTAPNAGATDEEGNVVLAADTTVSAALTDVNYNFIGGFPDDNTVYAALFTASMKLGVMELNRPEDVEWNPIDDRLYIAFTNNGRPTALDQQGLMLNDGLGGVSGVDERLDFEGAIFVLEEGDQTNPGSSDTFTFWAAAQGQRGNCTFCFEDPDNIMIDADGGVWFGTDGNFSTSRGTTDGLYFLDLDPAHQDGQPGVVNPTFGLPFRVVTGPSDSEATGPSFNSDMSTIFFGVQHPGERNPSTFPNGAE
jgi:secreted PhoX family phosphatase